MLDPDDETTPSGVRIANIRTGPGIATQYIGRVTTVFRITTLLLLCDNLECTAFCEARQLGGWR